MVGHIWGGGSCIYVPSQHVFRVQSWLLAMSLYWRRYLGLVSRRNWKISKPPPGTWIGKSVYSIYIASNYKKTKNQGLFAGGAMKMVKRPRDWSQKLWKGHEMEVLVFGIASDMTRIEFKKPANRMDCTVWREEGLEETINIFGWCFPRDVVVVYGDWF